MTARGHATRTPRDPIALASGRVVVHTIAANGSQDATMADGGDMSEAEWQEYCALLRRLDGEAERYERCSVCAQHYAARVDEDEDEDEEVRS